MPRLPPVVLPAALSCRKKGASDMRLQQQEHGACLPLWLWLTVIAAGSGTSVTVLPGASGVPRWSAGRVVAAVTTSILARVPCTRCVPVLPCQKTLR